MRTWIWSPAWSSELGRDLADLYRPLICALECGVARFCEVAVLSGKLEAPPESLAPGDVFLLVSAVGWDGVPLAEILERGARTVMYQTEPLGDPLPDWLPGFFASGLSEVWDYSHANVTRLRPLARATNVRLRYVPPGYAPALDFGGAPQNRTPGPVVFLGEIYGSRQGVLQRLAQQGLEVKHITGMYDRDALVSLFGRHRSFLNLHKHAGDPSQPVEMLRMALLLSNRCLVVSELSDAQDMHELSSLVHFHPLDRLADACRGVLANPRWEEAIETAHREFRQRFAMDPIFDRAGLNDLFASASGG